VKNLADTKAQKMERTILIIDDDEMLNRLLTNFLSEFGFKTVTAIHPEDGHKALNQKYFDQCRFTELTNPVRNEPAAMVWG
jgi:DNA-binding NtrC family response regulator